MELNLKKPVVIFDLETTGIDVVNDRIVEIAYIKVFPDGTEEEKTQRINPDMPIPEQSSKIHGIYDDDVKDMPKFKDYAKNISKVLEGSDLGGFNSNKFDIPLLAEEFLRVDVDFDFKKRRFIDVQVIFHKMERRTLIAAYKFYCGKDLVGAHGAAADTRATYEVLKAQIDRYKGVDFEDMDGKKTQPIINDIEALSEFSSHKKNVDFAGRIVLNDKGVEVFNFGKYKDTPVEKVFEKDPGYYGWMLKSEFPLYTKKILTQIKLRAMQK
ncbi:MAG: 3'-5' exonuclease [Salinivirgaceae bacterium]|jgi:DNA polymerase-3 subunit epsilon|nr:3'-5' exonuclease [Salinivirgaceae bacterium]